MRNAEDRIDDFARLDMSSLQITRAQTDGYPKTAMCRICDEAITKSGFNWPWIHDKDRKLVAVQGGGTNMLRAKHRKMLGAASGHEAMPDR